MAIILTGIWIRPEEPFEKAAQTARRQLRVNPKDILSIYPVKSSIDARHPDKIRIVYSVGVELTCDEEAVLQRANLSNAFLRRDSALELSFGTEPMTHRPVVAGFGPAGMFAALLLSQQGYRPLVLERGMDVDARIRASGRILEVRYIGCKDKCTVWRGRRRNFFRWQIDHSHP